MLAQKIYDFLKGDRMKKEIDIRNEKVRLVSLAQDNLENYLLIQKRGSLFAKGYETMEGLWDYMKSCYAEHLEDGNLHCLIYENDTGAPCGFIECIMEKEDVREIGIGILPEYRRKGLGYAASGLFIDFLFENGYANHIDWMLFENNIASRKLAEKLGGKKTGTRGFWEKTFQEKGYPVDAEIKERFADVIYRIEP